MKKTVCGLAALAALIPVCARTIPSGNRASASTYRWNGTRGYLPFGHSGPDGIIIADTLPEAIAESLTLPAPVGSFSLSFRAANRHSHPRKKYRHALANGQTHAVKFPAWRMFVVFEDRDTIRFEVKTSEKPDLLSASDYLEVAVLSPRLSGGEEWRVPAGGTDIYDGDNIWQLSLSGTTLSLWGGNRTLSHILSVAASGSPCTAFGFEAMPGAEIRVADIAFTDTSPAAGKDSDRLCIPLSDLKSRLAGSRDSLEGYWTLFDRTLDESLLRMGGDYRFAMVKEEGRYLLLYLSGARVCPNEWKEGMVKAVFTPTPFPGIYDAEWTDAEGKKISESVKAQEGEGATLTVQFPYHNSTLRLRKIP